MNWQIYIFEYGEEEKSRRIARAIVEARKKKPIDTAKELGDLVAKVKWRRGQDTSGNKNIPGDTDRNEPRA